MDLLKEYEWRVMKSSLQGSRLRGHQKVSASVTAVYTPAKNHGGGNAAPWTVATSGLLPSSSSCGEANCLAAPESSH